MHVFEAIKKRVYCWSKRPISGSVFFYLHCLVMILRAASAFERCFHWAFLNLDFYFHHIFTALQNSVKKKDYGLMNSDTC